MSRRFSGHQLAALALAVTASLATFSLQAQTSPTAEPNTIYFGQRRQMDLPKFWVAPVRATLDLRAFHNRTETSTTGAETTRTRDTLFQEQLTLFTHGFVVHPNLVDFRFSVSGGLSQGTFTDDNGSGETLGTIYGWDIGVVFLRNEPGNLTLYTHRGETIVDVPFGPTQLTTTTRSGAIYNYRTVESYMQFEAFTETNNQRAAGGADDDFSEERYAFIGNGQSQLSDNQVLDWNFGLEQVTFDNSGGSSDEQSISGSVAHTATFGDGNRNALTSALSYSQTTGVLDRRDLRWTEHMHLYHTPTFETNYDYRYQQLTYGNGTVDRHEAWMDARHQLFKSLQTIGRVGAEHVETENNTTKTYTADLTLNYRKEVTNGVFFADARAGYEIQQLDGAGALFVNDQPISFTGLAPVSVAQPNVVPDSVLIRDAVSGRTFVENVDYALRPTPVGLEIDRILGGNIAPGQPLFASYFYDPLDANEIETNTFGLGTRYQILRGPLAGFTPYARFFGQDQTISGGDAPPNNVRDYVVGLEYQTGGLLLRAEREYYDSSLFPFDAWRYEARYTHRLSSETSLSTSAIYTETQYEEPFQETQSIALNANVTQRLTTQLYLSLYAAYAHVDTTGGGTTQGFEQGLEANWMHRQTKVYLRLRNSTLESEVTEQNFQFLQFGLTRYF